MLGRLFQGRKHLRELRAPWVRVNRNSLAQWWAKRGPRYLVRNGTSNRKRRRVEAALLRHLARKGVIDAVL